MSLCLRSSLKRVIVTEVGERWGGGKVPFNKDSRS